MRKTRREAFWRGVVGEQSGSGLSIRAFCRGRRLSEASFYGWRRELRRRDEEKTEVAPASVEAAPNERTPDERPPRFVPVSLRQAAWRAVAEPAIEMVLPSGSVVRMPADVEQAEVAAALIAQVERRLC